MDIKEIEEEIERLKPIIEENKKKKVDEFQKIQHLTVELVETQKIYNEYRLILSDPLIELSDEEYEQIEKLMPILEKK